ncbi:MAG: hypothetical protein WCX84_05760 [Syntrophales bacterium]|jgi:hypothetical protein|nr:hypothetical protein [Syntrophales bacterium]
MTKATPMKVILYISKDYPEGHKLQSVIEKIIPKHLLVVFNMVSALSQGLRGPLSDTILVLCPSCTEEVRALAALRKLIRDVRSILILPDEEADTVAMGHRFHPRFLTKPTPGFKDVVKVLGRMLHVKS